MASYSDKPMSFSFKKPEGAKPRPEPMTEESAEVEPMSGDELGTALKAAMATGGDALYQAVCNIIDAHSKG